MHPQTFALITHYQTFLEKSHNTVFKEGIRVKEEVVKLTPNIAEGS